MNKKFTFLKRPLLSLLCLCFFINLNAQGGILIEEQKTCSNKNVQVEIKGADWENVTSMQFTLEWNHEVLQYQSTALPNDDFDNMAFGASSTDEGRLNISWFDGSTTLSGVSFEEETTFVVNFIAIGEEGEDSELEITSNAAIIEFTYNDNGNVTLFDPTLDEGLVVFESPVVASQTIQDATATNADGSISVSASGGDNPYEYEWDNGMSGSTINNLVAGDYNCTVSDANGCSTVNGPYTVMSMTSSTKDITGLTSFDLSPNPASETVNVRVTFDQNETTNVRVLSVTGKVLYQVERNGSSFSLDIPVTDFPNGTYFLELGTAEGTAIQKLVVAK